MKKFQFLLFVLLTNVLIAQENVQISPNGVFDKVFTRYGDSLNLSDLFVDGRFKDSTINPKAILIPCNSGYFNLYYDVNSGMAGSTPLEQARRDVICQVFSDLSQFIIPANSTVRVNILIDNVNKWIPGYNPITNPNPAATSMVGGFGTGFYTFPNSAFTVGGIIDNEIWKTINGGIDSYSTVSSPLYSSSSGTGPSGAFFHGMVAFNFSNPLFNNWHLNLLTSPPANYLDLYTIALHEITHALGLTSLINANGNSRFGSYNYYSRYDTYLRAQGNIPLIIPASTTCGTYNFGFNPALNSSILTPLGNVTTVNSANCATQINFSGSVNQKIYTPSSFDPGSSLSHLEDQCHLPNGYTNDQYYLMSNSGGTGPLFMKRFLQSEERKVLCDIGYKVNNIFGNSSNLNFKDYGVPICPGTNIVGINDGLNPTGTFQYVINAGTVPTTISNIISNDINATGFKCLEDVYGTGNAIQISPTSFTYSSINPGIALLRYIPLNGTVEGNITYVFILIKSIDCSASNCSLVNNGNFEANTGCGGPPGTAKKIKCWSNYCNTPDVFKRNCTGAPGSAWGVPTGQCIPPSDTWSGAPTNDGFYGMGSTGGLSPHFNEGMQSNLNTFLIPGNTYKITFRARIANNSYFNGGSIFVGGYGVVTMAGSTGTLAPINMPFTSLPSTLVQFGNPMVVPNSGNWELITQTFTYSGASTNIENLVVINTTNMATVLFPLNVYILIDDVNFEDVSPGLGLSLPNILCLNQTIPDMSLYAPVGGGVFSGSGVSFTSTPSPAGTFSFNATNAGVGTHTITYVYTNSNGCVITKNQDIQVVSSFISASATATPFNACVGQTVLLTGTSTGATNLVWNPGNLTGSTVSLVFSAPTLYTLTATNTEGCVTTSSISVGMEMSPVVSVSPTSATICPSQSVALTASGANSYTWSPPMGLSSTSGTSVNASPIISTTYTVTGTNLSGCTATSSTSITVAPCTDCLTGTLLSGTISTSPTHSQTLRIANNITISGSNVVFSRNNVKIMPGVTITVASGAMLTIEGSHFYGCDKMWQGIKVLSGGKVNVTPYFTTKTSLIEDAIVAIDFNVINTVQPNAVLTVNQAIFNKNRTAIQFNGYAFPNVASLFTIKNSLFTSRAIYNAQTATWPLISAVKVLNNSTNPFVDPYIVEANYPFSFLKAPNANTFALQGLVLKNVGTTVLGTSYTYYSATIGSATASEYNVFDLLRVGIQAENSNFKVINTTFQFPKVITTNLNTAGVPNLGTGIYVNGTLGTNYKVDVAGTAALPNKFYGLQRALHVKSYRNVQFTYNTIRSRKTQQTASVYHNGKYGVYMDMTNYDNVLVSNNTIYNIYSGVYLGSSASGNFPLVKVIDNTFKKDLGTTIGAIASSSIYLTNMVTAINYGGTVWVNNNIIDGTYNGIILKSWKKAALQVNSNTIFLKALNTSSTIMSNGIELNACEMGTTRTQIFNNNITGFSPLIASSKAISITTSTNIDVLCNKVRNTYSGLYFSGNCNPTKTSKNDMENHKYGFTLDNGGVIGQQGTSTVPADNRWLGLASSWTGSNYKNACLNVSSTIYSPMYVRSGAQYTPNGSVFAGFGCFSYTNSGNNITLPPLGIVPPVYTLCALPQDPSEPENLAETVSALESSTNPANAPASADMGAVVLNQSYRILDANTSLLQNSTALSTFYADNATSNTAKLLNVEKAVASNNLTLATTQNAAVVPENTMEESYKLFYEALLNYQNGTFSDTDSLIVTELATGCPTVQGSAVSQSATLYNAVYQTAEVFDNYCPDWVDKSMHISNEYTANGEQVINYKIYPVPNNGLFFINGKLKANDKVLVYSNEGKLVFEYTGMEERETTAIKTKLSSGSYIVKLVSSEGKDLFHGNIVVIDEQ